MGSISDAAPRRADRAWRAVGRAPTGFVPEQIYAEPDGSGLIGGWSGADVAHRRGMILAVSATGEVVVEWEGHGWVRALDRRGDTCFAILGRVADGGPGFNLLRGAAGSWSDLGEIPAVSVTSVCAVGPDEAWMLGAGALCRWDGQFSVVDAPGERDGTTDRLFLAGEQLVLATPAGLWLPRDGGARWVRREADGAHIRALSFPYVAAPRAAGIGIGRLEPAWLSWIGNVEGRGDPIALAWAGTGMQMAIAPADPRAHPGILLVSSDPAGGFSTTLLHIPPQDAWIGLAGARGALALTADRRVLQAGP